MWISTFSLGRSTGFGLVAQNFDGKIMIAASLLHGSLLCAAVVEAMALRWAIHMARDLDFMRVQPETDSLVVFNAWNNCSKQLSYVAAIVRECNSLSMFFSSFTLLHTR